LSRGLEQDKEGGKRGVKNKRYNHETHEIHEKLPGKKISFMD
jgi:hypothetical protein